MKQKLFDILLVFFGIIVLFIFGVAAVIAMCIDIILILVDIMLAPIAFFAWLFFDKNILMFLHEWYVKIPIIKDLVGNGQKDNC